MKRGKEDIGEIGFAVNGYACRLWWSKKGVSRFTFRRGSPAASLQDVRKIMNERSDLPGFVARALGILEDYFCGREVDFQSIPLDVKASTEFSRKVYHAVRKIPYGETASYKDIAGRAGNNLASRAVGMCMKKNPLPIFIPCHRVIGKDRSPRGFSSPDGVKMKVKLLAMEGVKLL